MSVRRPARLAPALAVLFCLAVAACASDPAPSPAESSSATAPAPEAGAPGRGPVAARPKRRGPAIRVTWEALARERYLYENSEHRRPGTAIPDLRIALLSESHPDASKVRAGRTEAQRREHAQSAVLPDRDLLAFVQELEKAGFYRHAKATAYQAALLRNPSARGRITVERGGESYTLVSMRGQGLNVRTREIPRLYSEAKQSVMVLRNRTPTLNVSTFGTQRVR